jgi:hypothetical protein
VDLDVVPFGLQSDDGVGQDELSLALMQSTDAPTDERDDYQKKKVFKVPLSRYKMEYDRQNERNALHLLQSRCSVVIDDEFKVSTDDDLLSFDSSKHFLDYFLVSSEQLGLWAAIPNVEYNHNFFVEFNLGRPYRDFKCKYAKLNYDPKGRFLWVGRVRDEDLYIAMCPRVVSEGEVDPIAPGHSTGDTRLKTKHYRMLVMFLAQAFSRLPSKSYDCYNPYSIDIEGKSPGFSLETNIL